MGWEWGKKYDMVLFTWIIIPYCGWGEVAYTYSCWAGIYIHRYIHTYIRLHLGNYKLRQVCRWNYQRWWEEFVLYQRLYGFQPMKQ